jgi:GR25 family glycosyltransferase involved in LPS biosynthesis
MEGIDAVIYINLEKRKDRKVEMEQELNRMGIKAERFDAIEHEYGLIGCLESHLEVLKMAKRRKYKNVLVLEDDFEFLVTPEQLKSELKAVLTSTQYDVLMLGYNIQKSTSFNSQLLKIQEASTASAYIVHHSFYDSLISLYTSSLPIYKKTRDNFYANDKIWRQLQPKSKWYAFKKRLGKQRASFSDNTGQFEDYGC